jgi:alpha-ketoglutarate-dependent taurine dioxygenase
LGNYNCTAYRPERKKKELPPLRKHEPRSAIGADPLSPRIGAQIRGIRLSGDLPDETVAGIEAALGRHKVIFFRDQGHLDDAEQERFTVRFGDLTPHPTTPPREGSVAIFELDSSEGRGRADRWHTDVTFVDAYPRLSILRAVTVPPFGGDTVWANTVAAYEHLPQTLKSFAENLWAIHSNLYDYAAQRPQATLAATKHYEEVFASKEYETEHPLVRVLALTGERSLVLGSFFRRFAGFSQSDSNHLFEIFQDHITKLENTVRWRWQAGDVAIWDNTATQHCAINDYGDQKRIVRRTTVKGDVPVSADGRPSIMRIKGARPVPQSMQVAAE